MDGSPAPDYLSFQRLDELHDLRDQAAVSEVLANSSIRRIGPLVEYVFQEANLPALYPPLERTHTSRMVTRLYEVIHARELRCEPSTTSAHKSFEFSTRLHSTTRRENARWDAYCRRFERAALAAGFNRSLAAGLTGALLELASNVADHSERPNTSLTGYRYAQDEFEFVVADAGIGVLSSFRKNPEYSHLTDAGAALRTAIQPGESRFGRNQGRGTGFETVFRSLRNLNGMMRLRSGDHSLTLRRVAPNQLRPFLGTLPPYQGCLVSVVCRPIENAHAHPLSGHAS